MDWMKADDLKKVLEEHTKAQENTSFLKGLLNDLYPELTGSCRLLVELHSLGIVEDIKKLELNNQLMFRYQKKLENEFGTSEELSKKAVLLWFEAYGQGILKKTILFENEKAQPQETKTTETKQAGRLTRQEWSLAFFQKNNRTPNYQEYMDAVKYGEVEFEQIQPSSKPATKPSTTKVAQPVPAKVSPTATKQTTPTTTQVTKKQKSSGVTAAIWATVVLTLIAIIAAVNSNNNDIPTTYENQTYGWFDNSNNWGVFNGYYKTPDVVVSIEDYSIVKAPEGSFIVSNDAPFSAYLVVQFWLRNDSGQNNYKLNLLKDVISFDQTPPNENISFYKDPDGKGFAIDGLTRSYEKLDTDAGSFVTVAVYIDDATNYVNFHFHQPDSNDSEKTLSVPINH